MLNLENKQHKRIGDSPTFLEEGDLLNYFLYAFEFSWNAESFEDLKPNLKDYFYSELKVLKGNLSQSLSVGQEWWALVLISLKQESIYAECAYPLQVINYLLSKIEQLSEHELSNYANKLNWMISYHSSDGLTIRPLLLKELGSSVLEGNELLTFLVENRDVMLEKIQGIIDESDIDTMYLNELTLPENMIDKKYVDKWTNYYEIFVGFSQSMYEMVQYTPKATAEDYISVLEEILFIVAVGSINNEKKVSLLIDEMKEVLSPFYLDFLSKKDEGNYI